MAEQTGRITIKEGGWVLILMGVFLLSIVIWAVAPAFLRMNDAFLGDGATPESYQFDLSHLQIDPAVFLPAMQHRNMSPVLTDPQTLTAEEIETKNRVQRSPFLVSKDLVVGVEIGGEARAYPLHMLHIHEIINDTVGGVPIVVSWHWPSGHIAVHKRIVGGQTVAFANSGLSGNGCLLMYPMQEIEGGEQLFSPIMNASVTGVYVALEEITHETTSWTSWLKQHPKTTSTKPIDRFKKRYRKGDPRTYFLNDTIYFPAAPMPNDYLNPKTPVFVLRVDGANAVYTFDSLLAAADDSGVVNVAGLPMTIKVNAMPLFAVARDKDGSLVRSTRALWFAWHANHPEDKIRTPHSSP